MKVPHVLQDFAPFGADFKLKSLILILRGLDTGFGHGGGRGHSAIPLALLCMIEKKLGSGLSLYLPA